MEENPFEKATNYFNNKNFEKAIDYFKICLHEEKKKSQSFEFIGRCYYLLREFNEAEINLKNAIDENNNNIQAKHCLALVYITLTKYYEASQIFNNLIGFDRKKIEYKIGLAASYLGLGRAREAEIIIEPLVINEEKLIRKNKRILQVYFAIKNELDKHQEVIDTIEKLKDEKNITEDIDILQQKIIALTGLKKYDEALAIINERDTENNSNELFLLKSNIYYEKGMNKEAAESMIEVMERIQPDNSSFQYNQYYIYYYYQARLYNKLNKPPQEIINIYKKCMDLNPGYVNAYIEIAKNQINFGLYDKALKVLNRIEERKIKEGNINNEILLLLYIVQAMSFSNKKVDKDEAKKRIQEVRDLLFDEKNRNLYSTKKLIEIFEKYFYICSFPFGYDPSDLKIFSNYELGRGSFSILYHGLQNKKTKVCVKQFINSDKINFSSHLDFLIKIFYEFTYMQKLQENENDNSLDNYLLKAICFFVKSNYLLLTPLCRGKTLQEMLIDKKEIKNNAKIEILLQLAKAIRYMQSFSQPYIHNNINSSNILFVDEINPKGGNQIKLCGFGHVFHEVQINKDFNPAYTAPEIIICGENPNLFSDVYSFSIVAWELFSGKLSFYGMDKKDILSNLQNGITNPLSDLPNSVPSEIKEIISKCFSNEPSKRFDIHTIIQKLEKIKL